MRVSKLHPAVYVTNVGESRSKANVILLENTNCKCDAVLERPEKGAARHSVSPGSSLIGHPQTR